MLFGPLNKDCLRNVDAQPIGKVDAADKDVGKLLLALMIGFGALVWWLLVQYVLPAVGVMLGLDKIPYLP